jgi:hypothetical protein
MRCSRRGGVGVENTSVFCTEGGVGSNLILNGDGGHLSSENFPGWSFVNEESPDGIGFFRRQVTGGLDFQPAQSLLPADTTSAYEHSAWLRSAPSSNHIHYHGFANYDEDRRLINPHHFYRIANGRLARPLRPGDTMVYLESTAGWLDNVGELNRHRRSLALWGYHNARGYRYPDFTYTRHSDLFMWEDGAIDRVNHTIRLNKPLPKHMENSAPGSGGVWPAGTAVSNTSSGSTYQYCAGSSYTPQSWQKYSGVIRGVSHSGTGEACKFPPGSAFVRPILLLGRTPTVPGTSTYYPLLPNPVTVDMAHIHWVQVR